MVLHRSPRHVHLFSSLWHKLMTIGHPLVLTSCRSTVPLCEIIHDSIYRAPSQLRQSPCIFGNMEEADFLKWSLIPPSVPIRSSSHDFDPVIVLITAHEQFIFWSWAHIGGVQSIIFRRGWSFSVVNSKLFLPVPGNERESKEKKFETEVRMACTFWQSLARNWEFWEWQISFGNSNKFSFYECRCELKMEDEYHSEPNRAWYQFADHCRADRARELILLDVHLSISWQ
jgi:hypothetical protein